MNKIRMFWAMIFKQGEHNIYRRILRTTLWGSLLTIVAMGIISLCSMMILQHVFEKESGVMSASVEDYLVQNLVKHHVSETTHLRAQLVSRLLGGCTKTVEFLAEKMTDIHKNDVKFEFKTLPVANYDEISDNVPYLYFSQELINQKIPTELREEILASSSIATDIARLSHRFYGSVNVASEHGYMIRMDMLDNNANSAVLCKEPLRSTYTYKDRNWYQLTKQANRLVLINPYMSSYGSFCISICAPYYDKSGFAGVVVADIESGYMYDRMQIADLEESEFSFIMNANGGIIFSTIKEGVFAISSQSTDLRNSDNQNLAELSRNMVERKQGLMTVQVNGKSYYLSFFPLADTGWSICSGIDKTEIIESADNIARSTFRIITENAHTLRHYLFEMFVLSAFLFCLVFVPILIANVRMARSIAAPINNLTQGVQEIAAGNLHKKLYIKTDDEIETLADSFNHMTEELVVYTENLAKTTAQNERIETELTVATRIQTGMLPNGSHPFPEHQEFDLAALMYPAREVGGDFYDFYFVDEYHLAITVADVSDKGVPAALFMVIAKTLLKDNLLFAGEHAKLGAVFEHTNDDLVKSNEADMFVTVFTGILDTRTGEFIYANAGHNPPLIRQAGRWRFLEKASSPILGTIEGLTYGASKLNLNSGDALLLYTDGVTEARDEQREFYGENRLLATLQTKSGSESAETEIKDVYATLQNYVGDAVQSDDITMLELVYWGSANNHVFHGMDMH